MKILFLLTIFSPGMEVAYGQVPAKAKPRGRTTDLLEIVVKAFHISIKEKPPGKKRVSFSFIPVATTSSGGNKIFVSSISAAFIIGNQDSTNVSSVYVLPYTDFSSNIGVGTKVNLWTANNKFNIPGEFRLSSLTQYSYGLGSSTEYSDRFKVAYNNLRLYAAANRRIFDHFYAGPGISYDRYYNVNQQDAPTSPSDFEKYGVGTGATSNSTGVTLNMLYDNRKNSINPDHGFYSTLVYRVNPSFLTNDNQWTSLYMDAQKYYAFDTHKRKILALWGMYWGSYGDVPYLNLPGTMLEPGLRSGRGYHQARFRGKQMLYFESEYRFDISNNGLFGAVVFANLQSLSEPTDNKFKYVNPAAGFGARIKFNKESNTNLTLDFGFGKDSFSFYLGLGEFF